MKRTAQPFMHRDVHRGEVVRGSRFDFCSPLKTFRLKPNRAAPGAVLSPANAGGGPARLRIHVAQREDVAMKHSDFTPSPQPFEVDLDDLLHPAQASRIRETWSPTRLDRQREAGHSCLLGLGRLCRRSGADAAPRPWSGRRGVGRRDPRGATRARLCASASTSAGSSTTRPRAALRRYADGFMRPSTSASISFSVSAVSGQVRATKSAWQQCL